MDRALFPPRPSISAGGVFTLVGRILAVCAVILTVPIVCASGQTVRVGVRAGPTFGFLNDSPVPFVSASGDIEADTNVRLDGHIGAYATLPLSERYGLQTELLYVRKGAHFSRFKQPFRSERYRLTYLEGQILGRRKIDLRGPLNLYAIAGLTLERLLNGQVKRDIRTRLNAFSETVDLAEQDLVTQWNVGALLGVGLGYPVGSESRIALEIRYNPGLRDVLTEAERLPETQKTPFDDPPPLTSSPPSLRHDVITASLSYTVPFFP